MKGQDFKPQKLYIFRNPANQLNWSLIEPKQRFCLKILNPTLWISAMYLEFWQRFNWL
jgi:hypothetical protein